MKKIESEKIFDKMVWLYLNTEDNEVIGIEAKGLL